MTRAKRRDDFQAAMKSQLAKRVGHVCSNPGRKGIPSRVRQVDGAKLPPKAQHAELAEPASGRAPPGLLCFGAGEQEPLDVLGRGGRERAEGRQDLEVARKRKPGHGSQSTSRIEMPQASQGKKVAPAPQWLHRPT